MSRCRSRRLLLLGLKPRYIDLQVLVANNDHQSATCLSYLSFEPPVCLTDTKCSLPCTPSHLWEPRHMMLLFARQETGKKVEMWKELLAFLEEISWVSLQFRWSWEENAIYAQCYNSPACHSYHKLFTTAHMTDVNVRIVIWLLFSNSTCEAAPSHYSYITALAGASLRSQPTGVPNAEASRLVVWGPEDLA